MMKYHMGQSEWVTYNEEPNKESQHLLTGEKEEGPKHYMQYNAL